MSLGINRDGADLQQVKADIAEGIALYLQAKPEALVVFASPVKSNSSLDYDSIYKELTESFPNSVFVSCYDAMDLVYGVDGNNAFYADNTHPSSEGLKRFVNYIVASTFSVLCLSTIKLTNSNAVVVDPVLPSVVVESGFYRLPEGNPEVNDGWRRLQEIAIEPNFTIKVDHGGNKFECIFLTEAGVLVDSKNSVLVTGETYRTVNVPANAYLMRCQVSDEAVLYDTLNYSVSVEYDIALVVNLTQAEINVGLDIPMTVE